MQYRFNLIIIDCHTLVEIFITKTRLCNEHPLTPDFYIVKLGFTGVYIFFLILFKNIDCGLTLEFFIEAVLTCTHNQCFEQN